MEIIVSEGAGKSTLIRGLIAVKRFIYDELNKIYMRIGIIGKRGSAGLEEIGYMSDCHDIEGVAT